MLGGCGEYCGNAQLILWWVLHWEYTKGGGERKQGSKEVERRRGEEIYTTCLQQTRLTIQKTEICTQQRKKKKYISAFCAFCLYLSKVDWQKSSTRHTCTREEEEDMQEQMQHSPPPLHTFIPQEQKKTNPTSENQKTLLLTHSKYHCLTKDIQTQKKIRHQVRHSDILSYQFSCTAIST